MQQKRILPLLMVAVMVLQLVTQTTISMTAFAEEFPTVNSANNLSDEKSILENYQTEGTEAKLEKNESTVIGDSDDSTTIESTKTESTVEKNDSSSVIKADIQPIQEKKAITDNLFKSVHLYKTNGEEIKPTDTLENGSALKMNLKFGFEQKNYQAGDTWSTQLPKQINIGKDISGNFSPITSANWKIDAATNLLTITFLEDNTKTEEYNLDLVSSLKIVTASTDENQQLVFDTIPTPTIYQIELASSAESGNNKTAIEMSNFNPNSATIESYFNLDRSKADNRYFTVEPYLYPSTLNISGVKVYSSVVNFNGELEGSKTLLTEGTDYELSITKQNTNRPNVQVMMKQALNKKAIVVETSVGAIDGKNYIEKDINKYNYFYGYSTTYEKNASGGSAILKQTSSYQSFQVAKPLNIKSEINKETGYIDWTIEYNYNEQPLSNKNSLSALIEDTGVKFVANSLSVNKSKLTYVTNNTFNVEDAGNGKDDFQIKMEDNGSFKMDYLKNTTQAFVIKYSTEIIDPKERVITNKINDGTNKDESSISLIPNLLYKESAEIDTYNQTMSWKITVNNDKARLNNAIVHDYFIGAVKDYSDLKVQIKGEGTTLTDLVEGQDYKVTKFDQTGSPAGVSPNVNGAPDKFNGGIRVNFIGKYAELRDTIQLTIVTKVQVTQGTTEIANKATLNYDGMPGVIEYDAKGTYTTPYANDGTKLVRYGTKDDNYIYQDWLVLVNANGNKYNTVKMEDVIPEDYELVADSLRYEKIDSKEKLDNINNYIVTNNNLAKKGDNAYPTSISTEDNTVKLSFDNLGTERVAVKFRTRIDKEWYVSKTFKNIATVTLGEKTNSFTAMAYPMNYEYAVNKKVVKDVNKPNVANWEINTLGITDVLKVKNPVITDTLDNKGTNVIYDPISFVLTDAKTNERIDSSLYDLVVTGNTFKISFKNYTATTNFKINYKTISEFPGAITNKVEIASESYGQLPSYYRTSTATTTLSFTNGSGEGIVKTADFTVTKVDQSDTDKLLPNAVFEIFTTENVTTGLKVTTDENGQAIFKDLPMGTYILKEIEAPEGYDISSEYKEGKQITVGEKQESNKIQVENSLSLIPAPVTVKYQNELGEDLVKSDVLTGEIGSAYETEAQNILGWVLKTTPTNAQGIYTDEAQEVVYVYERADAASVTVKYQDESGKDLVDSDILSGKVGLPYTTKASNILGWVLKTTPTNAQGIYTDEAQEVIYIYEQSDAANVTVKYQDELGKDLTESDILSGKLGLPYTTEAKKISGWTLKATPNNTQGTFTAKAQEVVYIYQKNPDKGIANKDKPSKNQTAKVNNSTNSSKNKKDKLPKTGEVATNLFVIVGLMLVVSMIGIKVFQTQKSKR